MAGSAMSSLLSLSEDIRLLLRDFSAGERTLEGARAFAARAHCHSCVAGGR